MKTTHKLTIGSLLLCGAMLSMGTQKNLQIVPYGHKMCSRLCDCPTCKWKFYFPNFTCDITFTQLPHDAEKHSWFCQTRQSLIQTPHTKPASDKPDGDKSHVVLFIGLGSSIYKFNSTTKLFELYANTSVRLILAVAFLKINNKVCIAGQTDIVSYHPIYGEEVFKSDITASFLAVDQEINTLFIIENSNKLSRIQSDGTGYKTLVKFGMFKVYAMAIDTKKKLIFGIVPMFSGQYNYTCNCNTYRFEIYSGPIPKAAAIRKVDKFMFYIVNSVIYGVTYDRSARGRFISHALSKLHRKTAFDMVYSSGRLYVTFVDGQTPYLAIVNVESKGLEKLVIRNVSDVGVAKIPVCGFTTT